MLFLTSFFCCFAHSFNKFNCEPKIEKYTPRDDADLIQVHIISRHGARTPLHLSSNVSNIWSCSNVEQMSIFDNGTESIKVNVAYGKSLLLGNCQFGQLLGKGAKQLKHVGMFLRDIYINKLKFLPSSFDQRLCKFRTTGSLRTIYTQMAIANGLYPGEKSIIMKYADKKNDPWKRKSLVCPNFAKLLKEYTTSSEYIEFGLEQLDFTQPLEEQLGVKWSSVMDVVTSALCQGFDLPPNITLSDVDKAIKLKAKQHLFLYTHDKIFPLFFSFQAAEILNEMFKRINGESEAKFYHWSAHDGNINSFLGYIGITDFTWPPYGSFIQIELYRFRKSKQYFLNFRLNGKLLKAPRFSYASLIPLKDFEGFVKSHLPDIISDCGFNKTKYLQQTLKPTETH